MKYFLGLLLFFFSFSANATMWEDYVWLAVIDAAYSDYSSGDIESLASLDYTAYDPLNLDSSFSSYWTLAQQQQPNLSQNQFVNLSVLMFGDVQYCMMAGCSLSVRARGRTGGFNPGPGHNDPE